MPFHLAVPCSEEVFCHSHNDNKQAFSETKQASSRTVLIAFWVGSYGGLPRVSTASLQGFLLPGVTAFPEQKEERTIKRSQLVAMFPCFSLPAVCARAIQKRGVREWIQCYGKFSYETHFAIFKVFRKPWWSRRNNISATCVNSWLAATQLN